MAYLDDASSVLTHNAAATVTEVLGVAAPQVTARDRRLVRIACVVTALIALIDLVLYAPRLF